MPKSDHDSDRDDTEQMAGQAPAPVAETTSMVSADPSVEARARKRKDVPRPVGRVEVGVFEIDYDREMAYLIDEGRFGPECRPLGFKK